jgi:hypothetical protein
VSLSKQWAHVPGNTMAFRRAAPIAGGCGLGDLDGGSRPSVRGDHQGLDVCDGRGSHGVGGNHGVVGERTDGGRRCRRRPCVVPKKPTTMRKVVKEGKEDGHGKC